jgi:hypothetical protein
VTGQMIIVCLDVGDGRQSRLVGHWGPETTPGWLLRVTVEGGRWCVAGPYHQSDEGWPVGTEYLDLPTAPPIEGLIQ